MDGFAEKKVVEGKLVAVKLDYDTKINAITITGDFFLYPEEGLEKIESAIVGVNTSVSDDELLKIIKSCVKDNQIEMIGITEQSLVEVIRMVLS